MKTTPARLRTLFLLILLAVGCTDTTPTALPTLPPPLRLSIATVPSGQVHLQQWIALYQEDHPEVEWEILPMAAAQAQQALAQGQVDLALLDQEIAPKHQGTITATAISDEAIAIIVHPKNNLRDLSTGAVVALFSGRVSDWNQVGGEMGNVQVYLPPASAGEVQVFAQEALADWHLASQAIVRASADSVAIAVAADPAGIGLVPLSAATAKVAALKIDGLPSAAKGYPWRMPLFLAYGSLSSEPALEFLHSLDPTTGPDR